MKKIFVLICLVLLTGIVRSEKILTNDEGTIYDVFVSSKTSIENGRIDIVGKNIYIYGANPKHFIVKNSTFTLPSDYYKTIYKITDTGIKKYNISISTK